MKLAKYSFLFGVIVSLVLLALTVFMNSSIVQRVSGLIGLVLFIGAIITSGAMVSGDRGRANYSNEDPIDKKQRENAALACFLAAIPILLLWGFLKY